MPQCRPEWKLLDYRKNSIRGFSFRRRPNPFAMRKIYFFIFFLTAHTKQRLFFGCQASVFLDVKTQTWNVLTDLESWCTYTNFLSFSAPSAALHFGPSEP
jgi:hypothetical protein